MAKKRITPKPDNADGKTLAQLAQDRKDSRAETARENGRKSRGPVTPGGKNKSSINAIRHGLCASKHTLLSTEFADEYDEVYQSFIQELRPATKAELRLVEKIANLDWRLERFVMMETCVLNLETGLSCDDTAARFDRIDGIGFVVEAWKGSSDTSHALDLLRRYMGTLQSQFSATMKAFLTLEKRRKERRRAGTDLDEDWSKPYQPPVFESQAPVEEPEEDAETECATENEKSEAEAQTHPLKLVEPSELITPKRVNEIWLPPKRPAA